MRASWSPAPSVAQDWRSRYSGEVAERFKALDLGSSGVSLTSRPRGFESHPLLRYYSFATFQPVYFQASFVALFLRISYAFPFVQACLVNMPKAI